MKNIQIFMTVWLAFSLNVSVATMAFAEQAKSKQKIVELLPEDFKPAFTRETVIKLNAIVRRSYDVIDEYDAIIDDVRGAVEQAVSTEMAEQETPEEAEQKIAQITTLAERSKHALSDMMAAVKKLKASDEEYNTAILAGMIDFVEDVEREISAEGVKLEEMLEAA